MSEIKTLQRPWVQKSEIQVKITLTNVSHVGNGVIALGVFHCRPKPPPYHIGFCKLATVHQLLL